MGREEITEITQQLRTLSREIGQLHWQEAQSTDAQVQSRLAELQILANSRWRELDSLVNQLRGKG